MAYLMRTDHIHKNFVHVGVQQNMPFLLLVRVHSQQVFELFHKMKIDARISGNL